MKLPKALTAVALVGLLHLGGRIAFAQHGAGPGASRGPAATSHRSMNMPETGESTGEHSNASASPTDVLSRNSKLDANLTTKLQSKKLLPAGTDLSSVCEGFRNLGQCVAAIHVSHNLNLSFACLKANMTGKASATGSNCPAGTGSSTSKLSLGKSIQALAPTANAGAEAKTGTKQANSDIQEAESTT